MTPKLDGNNFSFSGVIRGDANANGFSVTKSFNVRVVVKDKLSTSIYEMTLGTGIPAVAISKNGVAINGMYNEALKGALQVNGDVFINGKKLNS